MWSPWRTPRQRGGGPSPPGQASRGSARYTVKSSIWVRRSAALLSSGSLLNRWEKVIMLCPTAPAAGVAPVAPAAPASAEPGAGAGVAPGQLSGGSDPPSLGASQVPSALSDADSTA